jgi:hypothetical protein
VISTLNAFFYPVKKNIMHLRPPETKHSIFFAGGLPNLALVKVRDLFGWDEGLN